MILYKCDVCDKAYDVKKIRKITYPVKIDKCITNVTEDMCEKCATKLAKIIKNNFDYKHTFNCNDCSQTLCDKFNCKKEREITLNNF